jgi:hypothetical protein
MTLQVFIHSPSKRAKTIVLVDSGVTENFINLGYARHLGLPIQRLETIQCDRTKNKSGELKYYMDLKMQMC